MHPPKNIAPYIRLGELPTKITWDSKTPLRVGSYGATHPLVAWKERSGRLASRPCVLSQTRPGLA
jgi:hypothetical protein